MGIFNFGTISIKNLLKTSATTWYSEITFSDIICCCPSPETTVFSISATLDFDYILSANKGFTVFQNVLLSAVLRVPILLKKFLFSGLIKLTQRLRCLLHGFLLMPLFLFKNLFLSSNLFMISLFIVFYERILICTNISLFY